MSVKEAVNTLLKKVPGCKPVSYWVKGSTIVFRLADRPGTGCNYYIVDGINVRGTNPILSDLNMKDMKYI